MAARSAPSRGLGTNQRQFPASAVPVELEKAVIGKSNSCGVEVCVLTVTLLALIVELTD